MSNIVEFLYNKVKWTARLLPNSRCHVICANLSNNNDGMSYAVPTVAIQDIAWRVYHAGYVPTESELYSMLSIIDSYKTLLLKPVKYQRPLMKALKEVLIDEQSQSNEQYR